VLVAVSGGGDSTALLHLLHRLASPRRLRLAVAHLDHGLRRGSAADRRFVSALARDLGLPCLSDRRPVGPLRRRDESPEEAARRVRRAFLIEAAASSGSDRIALGHTLDDQAETIVLRLARGGGPRAVTGMAGAGPGPFVRPLLSIERTDLRRWLSARSLPWREDASNRSHAFDRNRLRRLVMPVLAEHVNPRAARHVVEAAARLRQDATLLDALARATLDAAPSPGGVPCALLRESPAPLARRMARLALERAGVDPRRIVARHVEGLCALAAGEGGKRLHLPGGLEAVRRRDRVAILAAV
jgi:tRNA(Ile)-lysidine synthase